MKTSYTIDPSLNLEKSNNDLIEYEFFIFLAFIILYNNVHYTGIFAQPYVSDKIFPAKIDYLNIKTKKLRVMCLFVYVCKNLLITMAETKTICLPQKT